MDQNIMEQLIAIRALNLLLYNFTQEDIDELCKNKNFEYAWNKLLRTRINKSYVDFQEFYNAFATNMSYQTQSLVLERAIFRYGLEAQNSVELSHKISKHES